MGEKWPKMDHIPPTFILGRIFPRTFGAPGLVSPQFSGYRLLHPRVGTSHPRILSAPPSVVLAAHYPCLSRALPMSATAHTTRRRQASTIRTRLNFGHIGRPYSSAKTTQTNVGNNLAMSAGRHWEGIINKGISAGSARVLQKLGKKLNNVPITTAGSKLFCRSAGPNFARKSTFWLDTAQKHIYTNNVEVISIGKLRLSTFSVFFGRSPHLVRS